MLCNNNFAVRSDVLCCRADRLDGFWDNFTTR